MQARYASNFDHLAKHDAQLSRLGSLAERYFPDDPNTCLLKLRQLTELIAQWVASRIGVYVSTDESQVDLLRRLQDHGIMSREVAGLFHEVRKAGNEPAPPPADFEQNVRGPGLNALLELIGDSAAPKRRGRKRKVLAKTIEELPAKCLPEFWRECLGQLRECYGHVCACLALKIHRTGLATVDHFVPKSKAQRLAYEWSNVRLAAHQVNAEKSEYEDVLDPFLVVNGWFSLDIGTFEVRAAPDLDPELTTAINQTIKRLKLNAPTFCQTRAECHDWYHGLGYATSGVPRPANSLVWLWEEAPFVAMELTRQGRLREADKAMRIWA